MFASVADKSFVLIRADWPNRQAQELLAVLDESHVIVEVVGPENVYYLLTVLKAEQALAESDEETLVRNALGLAQLKPTPVVDAYDNELDASAPRLAIVVERGDVIGFYDWDEVESEFSSGSLELTPRGSNGVSDSTVKRSVATRFPSQAIVGELALLAVYLTGDEVAGSLITELPVGAQLDVRVEALRRFEVVGPRKLSLSVQAEAGEPHLQFQLKATAMGLGAICVYVSVDDQPLGSITLEADVVASAADIDPLGISNPEMSYPLPAVSVLVPDLSLTIAEDKGKACLTFELKTREGYGGPQLSQTFDPVPLEQNPQAYFGKFFANLAGLKLSDAEDYFGRKGSELFQDLLPDKLRSVLWSLRDRIYSVQIVSQDPWIPWELCRLQGWEDDEIKDGPFLCEAFAVTRWMPRIQTKPALKLRDIALVVPGGSGLQHAFSERDHLLSLKKDPDRNVTLIPATRQQVVAAMKLGKYDAWHFAGHGELDPNKPNRSLLRLEKTDTLEPGDLAQGSVMNLGKAQPLVFLNACQTGQSIAGLAGAAGWNERFLQAAWDQEHQGNGAAAFIGAYWPVTSASAFDFAKTFYDELLGQNGGEAKTVGQAVLEARKAIKKENDPTWLAYTVFAHPLAKVESLGT